MKYNPTPTTAQDRPPDEVPDTLTHQLLSEADYQSAYQDTLRAINAPGMPCPELRTLRGPLRECIDWIEGCNPRSLPEAALGAALVGFGAAMARRVYIQWSEDPTARPQAVQQPIIVVARTGAGKDAPLRACGRMIELAGFKSLPALPYHLNRLYALLVQSGGSLGLTLDEVDGTLASLNARNEHAAGKEATIKSLLTCAARLQPPPVGARNVERIETDEVAGQGAWNAGVVRPALALLGVSTSGVWDRLSGGVTGGLVGRMLVLDADGPLSEPKPVAGNTDTPPAAVARWISQHVPCGIEGAYVIATPGEIRETDESYRLCRIVTPSSLARGAMIYAALELTREANEAHAQGRYDLADLLARAGEPVARVAALLSLGSSEHVSDTEIGPEHVFDALALVRWAVQRTAGQTEQRQETSDVARAIRLIRERLARPNVVRGIPTPWHYQVRILRGLESSSRQALQALQSTGEIRVDGRKIALESAAST